jgi:hypothetical protein
MKLSTAQKRIEKLGAKNNVLTINNKRLTILVKRGEIDTIMVENLEKENPFNTTGDRPFLFNYYRTLNHALNAMK